MSLIRLIAAALPLSFAAPAALAAGTALFIAIPRTESIPSDGTMVIDLFIDYSHVTSGHGIAGWKFDVVGNANGTLSGDVNDYVYPNGVNNGVPSGADLLDFAGGRLPIGFGHPTNFIGTLSFTDSGTAASDYTVALSLKDYTPGTGAMHIYIGASGSMSRSSLTSSTGTNHLVEFDIRPFHVIVPAPASLAAVPLVAFARRSARRARSSSTE